MLALAAINALGAVAFAGVYAAAGARWLTQAAFLASLVVFFVAVVALWLLAERLGGRRRDPLSRLGRIAGALVLTLVAVPGLVLMPLFALKDGLPAEAGLDGVIRPVMVLLLISLGLVAVANLAGSCLILARGLLASAGRRGVLKVRTAASPAPTGGGGDPRYDRRDGG